jgi:hypothetical protein
MDILQGEVKRRTTELHESEAKARELEDSYDAMKNYLQEVMKEIKRERAS